MPSDSSAQPAAAACPVDAGAGRSRPAPPPPGWLRHQTWWRPLGRAPCGRRSPGSSGWRREVRASWSRPVPGVDLGPPGRCVGVHAEAVVEPPGPDWSRPASSSGARPGSASSVAYSPGRHPRFSSTSSRPSRTATVGPARSSGTASDGPRRRSRGPHASPPGPARSSSRWDRQAEVDEDPEPVVRPETPPQADRALSSGPLHRIPACARRPASRGRPRARRDAAPRAGEPIARREPQSASRAAPGPARLARPVRAGDDVEAVQRASRSDRTLRRRRS